MKKRQRDVWIPVVTGLLRKESKILVGLRPEGHSLAGHWEFPGGKVEMGEAPEQALQRELQEELGIHAEVGALRFACTHSYGTTGIVLLFYEVNFWKGQIKSVHHSDLKWVGLETLPTLNIPEANSKVLPELIRLLKSPLEKPDSADKKSPPKD